MTHDHVGTANHRASNRVANAAPTWAAAKPAGAVLWGFSSRPQARHRPPVRPTLTVSAVSGI